MIIESIRNFIRTYPPLADGEIGVDFLKESAESYSVDAIPTKEIVKQYIDGSSIRQFIFVFATRSYYGSEIRQQLDNLGFFEDFTKWIEQCNKNGVFPKLEDGCEVQKLEVTTSGYVFSEGEDYARYQTQCRMEYFKPAAIN